MGRHEERTSKEGTPVRLCCETLGSHSRQRCQHGQQWRPPPTAAEEAGSRPRPTSAGFLSAHGRLVASATVGLKRPAEGHVSCARVLFEEAAVGLAGRLAGCKCTWAAPSLRRVESRPPPARGARRGLGGGAATPSIPSAKALLSALPRQGRRLSLGRTSLEETWA